MSLNVITEAVRDDPSNVFFHQAVISWTFRMKMTASFVYSTISRTAQIQVSILDECDVSLKIYQSFNYFFYLFCLKFKGFSWISVYGTPTVDWCIHATTAIQKFQSLKRYVWSSKRCMVSWHHELRTFHGQLTFRYGKPRGETWRWWMTCRDLWDPRPSWIAGGIGENTLLGNQQIAPAKSMVGR